jgi:hypothetical protein
MTLTEEQVMRVVGISLGPTGHSKDIVRKARGGGGVPINNAI